MEGRRNTGRKRGLGNGDGDGDCDGMRGGKRRGIYRSKGWLCINDPQLNDALTTVSTVAGYLVRVDCLLITQHLSTLVVSAGGSKWVSIMHSKSS